MSAERFLEPHELVAEGLAASTADECVLLVRDHSRSNVRFAVNRATSNGLKRSRDVTAIAIVRSGAGATVGSVTRSGAVDVTGLVQEATAVARTSPVAADVAELVAGGVDPDFGDPPGETTYEELATAVTALASAFTSATARGVVLAGYAEHEVTTTYLASSTGLRRRFEQPTGTFQLNARQPRPGGSVWTSAAMPHLRSLDVDAHVDEVHRRLEWSARYVELPAGRYDVVLPPIAVADLMGNLYARLSARDAREGRTAFSAADGMTKLGQRLCGLDLSLHSDPADTELRCIPFAAASSSSAVSSVFDNGAALDRTSWIERGTLTNLFTPRSDAAREGTAFSAPVDNLTLELAGAQSTTDELVAGTERGLLLTSLWYIREVDPATMLLTGLTRDGVYLIEDGKLVGGVNNFRFNESPVDVLRRATDVGGSVRAISREAGDRFSRTKMPPLLVTDFNMSSVSPAS